MKMMMKHPHHLFMPVVCILAFLVYYVMLKALPFHQPWVWSDISQLKTPENFTCSANDSKEVIPPNLDESFQNFLRFRHCRAFRTLLSPTPCKDDLYLLLAIKSSAAKVDHRAALRDTWGRAGLIKGRRVKLVFLMGRSLDQVQSHNLQPVLEWENHRYGDILQWDLEEHFFNLTRKEERFLSWFSRMCSRAQFVFKGDDDMFVNTEKLLEFLSVHKPQKHLLTGQINQEAFPVRDKNTKDYIPAEMYADKPYPPFPSGSGHLLSRQTMLDLAVAAQKVELFPLKDVFLGMCLQQMGLNITQHNDFLLGFSQGQTPFDPCVYNDLMLVHTPEPLELRFMWALLHDHSLPCGRETGRKTLWLSLDVPPKY